MTEQKQKQELKPIIEPGLYALFSVDYPTKGKALTIKNKSMKDGTHYCFEPFKKGNEHQLFYLYWDKDDGNYTIVSLYSSKCIATDSKYPDIGDPIVQLPVGFTSKKNGKLKKCLKMFVRNSDFLLQ